MFRKILLAAALQNWQTPTPFALAAREVAVQLARGSAHPLYVLTLYHHHTPAIPQNPFIGEEVIQETERLMKEYGSSSRAKLEELRKRQNPPTL